MKIFILSILLILTNVLLAQNNNKTWALGCGTCVNTNSGGTNVFTDTDTVITTFVQRTMNLSETNTGVCDKYGNLLFYTNGFWVANAVHDTIQNGYGLYNTNSAWGYASHGSISLQGAIALSMPNDSNKYYLIHETFGGIGGGISTPYFIVQYY